MRSRRSSRSSAESSEMVCGGQRADDLPQPISARCQRGTCRQRCRCAIPAANVFPGSGARRSDTGYVTATLSTRSRVPRGTRAGASRPGGERGRRRESSSCTGSRAWASPPCSAVRRGRARRRRQRRRARLPHGRADGARLPPAAGGFATSASCCAASTTPSPVVIALDHYEVFRLMDTWLRQVLAPGAARRRHARARRAGAAGRRLVRGRRLPQPPARPARRGRRARCSSAAASRRARRAASTGSPAAIRSRSRSPRRASSSTRSSRSRTPR